MVEGGKTKNLTPQEMIERASRKQQSNTSYVQRPIESYNLPPGPNPESEEADFIINEKQIYKKIISHYIPRYGSVFTLYKEEKPVIIISDIDTAYFLFVTKFSKQLAGRTANYGERLLSGNCNNILNNDFGPIWKILQRYLYKGLRYCAEFDRLDEIMSRCFLKLNEAIIYRGGTKATGVKMDEDLFWFSDNIMTMLLFNEIFNDSEYTKLSSVLQEIPSKIEECEFDYPKKRSEIQASEKLNVSLNRLFVIIQKKIDQHRQRGDYKISCMDITDYLLLAVEEYHMDPVARKLKVELSDLHVKHTIIDALFASQEGLGNSLLWILGLLATNPHIQERIRQEMDLFRDNCKNSVTLHLKSKMPYTMACLFEIQRYACADTFTDFHKAMEDIPLVIKSADGRQFNYEVPRGALVLINIYAIHHDPRRWNEPHLFKPERFLSPDGTKFVRRKDCIPYGLGLRTCTGNILSENILFLFILHLMDNYRLVWTNKNKSSQVQDDRNAVFIRDVQPFNVQFVPLKN